MTVVVKAATLVRSDPQTSLLPRSKGPVIALNTGWQVSEDELQWDACNAVRASAGGTAASAGQDPLCSACIGEYCGSVDPVGLLQVEALPDGTDDSRIFSAKRSQT